MRKNKKAFTLIELIAILAILAILALIVTPLVMNIVKKSKDSANKRSVDAYGKALELAVATYLLDNGEYPTTLDDLTVEYTGNEVVCNVKTLNEDGSIYLSECSVKGSEVKDSSADDGWYHYGKSTSTALTYQAYSIGDMVTYNDMNFYVIEDSDEASDSVTMLKAEPLTVDEVNTYGEGHVNNYTRYSIGTADEFSETGYGGMAYYSSETCGYVNGVEIKTGCTSDYEQSDIKKIVDAWATDNIGVNLVSSRLISYDDLTNNLGYERTNLSTIYASTDGTTPSWVYNSEYDYWTMSPYQDSVIDVFRIDRQGYMDGSPYGSNLVYKTKGVRPVVTILKSAI